MAEPLDVVAFAKCGCPRAWVHHSRVKDNAKEIGEWVGDGLDIRRMTTVESQALNWRGCVKCNRALAEPPLFAAGHGAGEGEG